jgi:cysteine desulfuration protein SufE
MSIEDIQREIVEEFSLFDDWTDRYQYLIELGKTMPIIADEHRTEEHLIRGCQSQVWLHAEFADGSVYFTADSDAIITKGMIALLIRVLSGHTSKEIAQADLTFIDKIGLSEHLSPSRANGLLNMIKQMKIYGLAFLAKD